MVTATINPYSTPKNGRKYAKITSIVCIALAGCAALSAVSMLFLNVHLPNGHRTGQEEIRVDDGKNSNSHHRSKPISETTTATEFIPTLRGKKIFFEITTVGLKTYYHLENMMDAVRDLCEAGAHVSFHITSSNCDPNPDPEKPECKIRNQFGSETLEDNFSVETISQLNERMRCRNPEGSLDLTVHLISPDWGKQLCDHHRLLFYENIDEGFDVFIHSEDDEHIRPMHVIAFLHEMEKVRQLVGNERYADYSIGFVRFERQVGRFDKRRVIWEFEWESELDMIDHPGIEDKYFTSPGNHHQGLFMATTDQLIAWKDRGPDCHFHKIERRDGLHMERVTGALDLYHEDFCNVTQLLPLDSFEDLLIHHMPDKNFYRTPMKIMTTMNLHKMRVKKRQELDEDVKLYVDEDGKYNGINMILDERDPTKSLHFDLTEHHAYVKNYGRLTEEQLKFWEYKDPNAKEYYEKEVEWIDD